MENCHFPRGKCMENGHFPRQNPTWIFQIPGGKWPFSMHEILRFFPWPGVFKLREENGHFPGLDFSNSGWKMAIFQTWIFQIPGGKWPFFQALIFSNLRWKIAIFQALDFANSGWKMVIFQAWIFQSFSNKILSFDKLDVKSIKAPCERY